MINFNTTKEEMETINKIANRAVKMFNVKKMEVSMDITACHLNGNPLELNNLLNADDFNFGHDITGISKHINRNTGKLTNCFSPRFSKKTNKEGQQ